MRDYRLEWVGVAVLLGIAAAALTIHFGTTGEPGTNQPTIDASLFTQQTAADTPCPPPTDLQCLGLLMDDYLILPLHEDNNVWMFTIPTEGTPAVKYAVQVRLSGSQAAVTMRTAGVDISGNQGPWSEWSEP